MKIIISCVGLDTRYNMEVESLDEFFIPLQALINGEFVFERQLRILREEGIRELTVCASDHVNELKAIAEMKGFSDLIIDWIDDSIYYRCSELFSPACGNSMLKEDTIIISGGLVFSGPFIRRFIDIIPTKSTAVKTGIDESSGEFILKVADGCIAEISNEITEDEHYAPLPIIHRYSGDDEIDIFGTKVEVYDDYFVEELCTLDNVKIINEVLYKSDIKAQKIYTDNYSFMKVQDILSDYHNSRPLIVCELNNNHFLKTYYTNLLHDHVLLEVKDEISEYDDILSWSSVYRENNCDCIISFGNDNIINAAKLIKLFTSIESPDSYLNANTELTNIKHINIPIGINSFSGALPGTIFIKDGKSVEYSHLGLLADYIVFEKILFSELSTEDRIFITLNALCSAVDSLWIAHNPSDKLYIGEAITSIINGIAFLAVPNSLVSTNLLGGIYSSVKASYIHGNTSAYSIGAKFAEYSGLPKGYGVALSSIFFWNHYGENLNQTSKDIGRKQVAATWKLIKSLFKVQTNRDFMELFLYLISEVLGVEIAADIDLNDLVLGEFDRATINNTPISMCTEDISRILNEISSFNKPFFKEDNIGEFQNPANWNSLVNQWKKRRLEYYQDRIRDVEMDILDRTVALCEENKLSYFLSYKSLLGVVRAADYRAWSDVLELSMPRSDYEKFRKIADNSLPEDYNTHSSHNDEYCWFSGLRIRKKNTYILKSEDKLYYTHKHGIFININPFDELKSNGFVEKIKYLLSRVIDVKIHNHLSTKPLSLGIKGSIVGKLISGYSVPGLHRLRYRLLKNRHGGNFILLRNKSPNSARGIVKKSDIYPLKEIAIGEKKYSVPNNAHGVLSSLYENYKDICVPKRQKPPIKVALEDMDTVIDFEYAKSSKVIAAPKGLFRIRGISKILRSMPKVVKFAARTKTKIKGFFVSRGIFMDENSRVLASYKDKYKGQRCFLIGNGPSLKAEELDLLKDEYTFACNLIYHIFEQTTWRPTYYCISDSTIPRINSKSILENMDDSTLIIREFAHRYMHMKIWDAVLLQSISTEDYKVHGNMLQYHYLSRATVMSLMLELAFYMGFEEIYIIGTDGTSSSKNGSHFIDNYFSNDMKAHADSIKKKVLKDYVPAERAAYLQARSLKIYSQLREYAEKNNIKVYNATRGGYIEIFERRDFDSVVNDK
jgi:alcohol dehydrogenase class IV